MVVGYLIRELRVLDKSMVVNVFVILVCLVYVLIGGVLIELFVVRFGGILFLGVFWCNGVEFVVDDVLF